MEENKIVILGNGFDLRHYLPTKYNHLLTILREIENYVFSEAEVTFSDLFDGIFKEKDEKFHEGILNYYNVDKIKFDSEKLKSIQERIKTNSWFQYLKSVEDDKIETWIDFENEINRVLEIVSIYFESFNRGDFEKIRFGYIADENNFFIDNFGNNVFFLNRLQQKILTNFNLFINKEEGRFSIVNKEFILNIGNEIQYFKEKYFFDIIYKSIEVFIGIFNDYIFFIVNKFYQNFKEEEKENFIKDGERLLFDNVLQIYSFNYTNTFKELFQFKNDNEKKKRILNSLLVSRKNVVQEFPHGKAIDSWNNFDELKIVLGVDDIDNSLKNNKLFQFTKYFQKLHKNTDYLFLDGIVSSYTPSEKFVFYFWGHSLDSSDKEYIESVFKILENNYKCKVICFFHSITSKADQLKNLLNIIGKNEIEKFMKEDKLIFLESTPENLFNELA